MNVRMERREKAVGGVGGQRLKLHHKSHPERKCEVVPPQPPSPPLPPSLPCCPAPPLFSSSTAPSPPFCFTLSAPWMDQVYFILLLHVLQTPKPRPIFTPAPLLLFICLLFPPPPSPPPPRPLPPPPCNHCPVAHL